MKRLLLCAILICGFIPAGAAEEKIVVTEDELIIDRDQDGRISRAEYQEAQVEYLIRKYDTDGDGKITAEEIKQVNKEKTKNGTVKGAGNLDFKKIDADKNGYLTRKEVERVVVKQKKTDWYFDTIDADKDGHISRIERPKDRPTVGGIKITF